MCPTFQGLSRSLEPTWIDRLNMSVCLSVCLSIYLKSQDYGDASAGVQQSHLTMLRQKGLVK